MLDFLRKMSVNNNPITSFLAHMFVGILCATFPCFGSHGRLSRSASEGWGVKLMERDAMQGNKEPII